MYAYIHMCEGSSQCLTSDIGAAHGTGYKARGRRFGNERLCFSPEADI